jgi:hypothetical protein
LKCESEKVAFSVVFGSFLDEGLKAYRRRKIPRESVGENSKMFEIKIIILILPGWFARHLFSSHNWIISFSTKKP